MSTCVDDPRARYRPPPSMTDADAVQDAIARAYAGGPERHRARPPSRASCRCASASRGCSTRARSPRTRCWPTGRPTGSAPTASSPGMGTIAGRTVALMANDPTVKAGSWGPKTVEKILRIQEAALAHRVPMVYLVDSAGARITEQVQMFPGRRHAGPHLLQRGQAVGRGAAGLRAVRPERRGRRLHPGVLRRRDHARRQRVDVPRLAADGRDGDRREGLARGDGRGARCTPACRAAGTSSSKSDEEGIDLAKRYLGYFPSHWEEAPPPAPPALRRRGRAADPRADPRRREQAVGHARAARRARRRGLVPRGPRALGEGADRRLRAARRARRRDRRQPAEVQGRRAVRRLRRQGRALHLDLQRVRRSRCCSSPTCPAS